MVSQDLLNVARVQIDAVESGIVGSKDSKVAATLQASDRVARVCGDDVGKLGQTSASESPDDVLRVRRKRA